MNKLAQHTYTFSIHVHKGNRVSFISLDDMIPINKHIVKYNDDYIYEIHLYTFKFPQGIKKDQKGLLKFESDYEKFEKIIMIGNR